MIKIPSVVRPAIGLFAASALALLVAGCAQKASAPSGESRPTAAISYKFDDGVDPGDRTLIRQTIAAARGFYVEKLGADLKLDITIEVTTGDGEPFLGYSYGRKAWLFTGGDWPKGSSLPAKYLKQQLVAHELFHNFQGDLQYTANALPSRSPWWLIEGSAEYAALKWILAAYGDDWATLMSFYGKPYDPDLPRLDAGGFASQERYEKAVLAVDALMGDRPLGVLGQYFADTGRMDWRDAFRKNFGQDPDAFLDRFEWGYRSR